MKKLKIAMLPTMFLLLVLLLKAQREIAAYDKYVCELHVYTAALENHVMKTERIGTRVLAVRRCKSCEDLFFHDPDEEPELCEKCREICEVVEKQCTNS